MNIDGEKIWSMTMGDFDMKSPITIDIEDKLHAAVAIFKEKQIDNIIAVSNGKPVGMVDVQDLVKLEII